MGGVQVNGYDKIRLDTCVIDGVDYPIAEFMIEHMAQDIVSAEGTEIDPKWSCVDQAGHFHAYDDKKQTPTLKSKVVRTWYCGDCEEEHEDSALFCVLCDEKVEPGRRTNWGKTTRISLGTRYELTVWSENLPSMAVNEQFSAHVAVAGMEWFGIVRVMNSDFTSDGSKTTYSGNFWKRM